MPGRFARICTPYEIGDMMRLLALLLVLGSLSAESLAPIEYVKMVDVDSSLEKINKAISNEEIPYGLYVSRAVIKVTKHRIASGMIDLRISINTGLLKDREFLKEIGLEIDGLIKIRRDAGVKAGLLVIQSVVHLVSNRKNDAIKCLEQARLLSPELPEIYNTMGVIYSLQGDPVNAISLYKEAIKRNPNYLDVHDNVAIAYKSIREEGMSIRYRIISQKLRNRLYNQD